MAEQVTGNTVPQRVSLHRNFAFKDYCIIAGLTLISLPLGFYFGRGNGKFVQKATMYTTGLLGLAGGYSIALVNTRKRILGE
ncbi:uncharacterized protein [Blastocystis hominis]|uniref:NADH-ubiquinone oxidoreductase 21kDa subunit N-terminal domain-containing protein n=1 Tax=Blastocystis hominis TaxID=12968 RepID=D8LW63_BLAHO|nr:uncharacterized protein [Blastocystis hominis]CBK20052.2 unnamed protein product [Blastocystis hominis]|eukprot:XP_012894100.1 uncharacterized protein [Blastocystis hominis]